MGQKKVSIFSEVFLLTAMRNNRMAVNRNSESHTRTIYTPMGQKEVSIFSEVSLFQGFDIIM